MRIGCNYVVSKDLLNQQKFDPNPYIEEGLIEGFSKELVKNFKDEIVATDSRSYRETVSFSLNLFVYTKKQHRVIVKALLEHYEDDEVARIMRGIHER